MRTLVIYYSLEGNTKFIAQTITGIIDADILELKPKIDIQKYGFMKYFWGGKQVVMKEKPELWPFDKRPQEYDLLFIGTPVWNGSHAPALNTFFTQANLKNKKIALFCCHSGDSRGERNTLIKMKESLLGNEIVGEIGFTEPLKKDKDDNANKARTWANNIILNNVRKS